MTATVERIRKEASQLPYDERETLVRVLELDLDSTAPADQNIAEIEADWDVQIKNRVDEIESRKVKLLSQEEFDSAFSEARQKIASRAPRA